MRQSANPKPKPSYVMTGIRGTRVVKSKGRSKPPTDVQMAVWGKERGLNFVLRFWPSKKGWMALDIRNAQVFDRATQRGTRYPSVVGHIRGTRVYPNEESAVMHLMAVMDGTQGKLI